MLRKYATRRGFFAFLCLTYILVLLFIFQDDNPSPPPPHNIYQIPSEIEDIGEDLQPLKIEYKEIEPKKQNQPTSVRGPKVPPKQPPKAPKPIPKFKPKVVEEDVEDAPVSVPVKAPPKAVNTPPKAAPKVVVEDEDQEEDPLPVVVKAPKSVKAPPKPAPKAQKVVEEDDSNKASVPVSVKGPQPKPVSTPPKANQPPKQPPKPGKKVVTTTKKNPPKALPPIYYPPFPYDHANLRLVARDRELAEDYFDTDDLSDIKSLPKQHLWNFSPDDFQLDLLEPFKSRVPPKEVKYFKESGNSNHGHRDNRYFKPVPDAEISEHLVDLFSGFAKFAAEKDLTYWIAHGTLIGWYWNERFLPWDDDIDIQTTVKGYTKFIPLDQTIYENRYLLDINPFSIINRQKNWARGTNLNKIDARWIDMESGMFIDITVLSLVNSTHKVCPPTNSTLGKRIGCDWKVSCKSPHYYFLQELSPLYVTKIEGATTWRPRGTLHILETEYSRGVLIKERFGSYFFKRPEGIWMIAPSTPKKN